MNRKILVVFAALFVISMMATPFAIAKPGAEKNNEKFEYFSLLITGAPDTTTGIIKETFIGEIVKTRHVTGRGWLPGEVVELTVGDKVFTMDSEPYSVEYTTTFDAIAIFNNDGTSKQTLVKLVDVVTLYDGEEAIGTLVLKINAVIDFSVVPPAYGGTVQGYGTDALEGVYVSAVDLGFDGTSYQRVGTITGWPAEITNVV